MKRRLICLLSFLAAAMLFLSLGTAVSGYADETGGESQEKPAEIKIKEIWYDDALDHVFVAVDTGVDHIVEDDFEVWVAQLKSESGTLTAKNFKSFKRSTSCYAYHNYSGNYVVEIGFPLYDKTDGFKIAENKDAYLYITLEKPASGKKEYSANLVIKGNDTKISKIELDYVEASKAGSEEFAISSFSVKSGSDKKDYSKSDLKTFTDEMAMLYFCFAEASEKNPCVDNAVYLSYEYVFYPNENPISSTAIEAVKIRNSKGNLHFAGTFTLKSGVNLNSKEALTNGDNWIFEYDKNETERLYRVKVIYDYEESEDVDITQHGFANKEAIIERAKSYISIVTGDDYWAYWYDNGRYYYGKNSFIMNDDVIGSVYSDIVELDTKNFEYHFLYDGYRPSISRGFVGDIVVNSEFFSLPEEIRNRIVVRFEALPDAETAKDFGLELFVHDISKAKEGMRFVINSKPDYKLNAALLSEYVACAYEDEKCNLWLKYSGGYINDKTWTRCSKAAKVSVKKPAKPQKVKIDVSKDIVQIKNGFDFCLNWDEEMTYTIRPFNKDGTATDSLIYTSNYKTVKKAAEARELFTSEKVSGIPVEKLFELAGGEVDLMVRKSAGVGKPASVYGEQSYFLELRALPPVFTNAKENYVVAIDEKNTFVLNGIKSGLETPVSNQFEYVIMDKADFEAELANPGTIRCDLIKWAKCANGTKLTLDKTSSKYAGVGEEKASKHTFTKDSYILIREKGNKVKDGSDFAYTLATDYVVLKVGEAVVSDGSAESGESTGGEKSPVLVINSCKVSFSSNSGELNLAEDEKKRIEWIDNYVFSVPVGGKLKAYQFPFAAGDTVAGHKLLGWADDKEATVPNVDASKKYTSTEPVTLYAIWDTSGESQQSQQGEQSEPGE